MNVQAEFRAPATEPASTGAAADVACISLDGVSKTFGHGVDEVRALERVSLDIADAEFFTLLGPSGCGKTTLLRLLAGFEQPTEGGIHLFGEDMAGLPPFRRAVNTVFQSYALFPHMTVAENVAFGPEMQGLGKAEIGERVDEVLRLVKLDGYERRKPSQLSGGQQQRVALARALANRPKVLLLDEPLSALDLKLRKEMQIELKRLQSDTGITFVFVTHDQEEALTMSDRLAVMSGGHVLQVGSPRDIYEQPDNRFVADFIGETNLLTARVTTLDSGGGTYRLPSGAIVRGRSRDGLAEGAEVTLALRPERTSLADGSDALMQGRVDNVVYFGTDTLYQIEIEGIGLFQVRTQNVNGSNDNAIMGSNVGITFAPDAIQVLRD